MGEQGGSRPGHLFASMAVPIDARVPHKVNENILSHDYIDFGMLLYATPQTQGYHLTVNTASEKSTSPLLSLEPTHKPRRINTVEQWTTAFQVFVVVYTSKFATWAPAITKYGEVIPDLAGTGAGWRFYDENFRYLMQKQPNAVSWGEIHWELWLRAQHTQPCQEQHHVHLKTV